MYVYLDICSWKNYVRRERTCGIAAVVPLFSLVFSFSSELARTAKREKIVIVEYFLIEDFFTVLTSRTEPAFDTVTLETATVRSLLAGTTIIAKIGRASWTECANGWCRICSIS